MLTALLPAVCTLPSDVLVVNERSRSNDKLSLPRDLDDKVITFTAEEKRDIGVSQTAGHAPQKWVPCSPRSSPVTAETKDLPVTDNEREELVPRCVHCKTNTPGQSDP